MRRAALAVGAVMLAALVTAGCSSSTQDSAVPTGQDGSSIAARQQTTGGIVPGYTVSIPRLGETSTLVGLGLNADRTIQVPPLADPMQAGVYTNGPMPGQDGPAVVLAHVNAGGHPGFGQGFHILAAGDEIDAGTPTGPVKFVVTQTITVAKDAFPTGRIYSDSPGPELRLITCGGELDTTAHNYESNVVVFARKAT